MLSVTRRELYAALEVTEENVYVRAAMRLVLSLSLRLSDETKVKKRREIEQGVQIGIRRCVCGEQNVV